MSAELIDLVHRLGQPEVLVVGDLMLDRYVWGNAERVSQEAPVVLLHADRREERLGGASSVAALLRALGARVSLAGVVGADADGKHIRELLNDLGIDHDAVLIDDSRPSTVKERYLGRAQQKHPQQMIRVDYEVRDPLSGALESRLKVILSGRVRQADVVLVSDYDKGVCTPGLLARLIHAGRELSRRVVVDPVRRSDYRKYHGCAAVTPNRLEAGLATGRTIRTSSDALAAAEQLVRQLDLEAGIVTLDKDGMALVHRDGRRQVFPTRPRQVYDITGAGDMVLSVLGMALAAGADYADAIRLANVAGGLEVEKVGVAPVSRDEILHDLIRASDAANAIPPRPHATVDSAAARKRSTADQTIVLHGTKVVDRPTLQRLVANRRRAGGKIAFTNGCFDLLHAGHVQYLEEARRQADVLVVGVNSDASVQALKGPARPIHPAAARAAVIAGLQAVDFVTVFEELTPLELIKAIKPDVLVKGADYTRDRVVGADFVESYGGRVHIAAVKPGFSTTQIVEKLQGESRRQVA